jgi:hypothetical protein
MTPKPPPPRSRHSRPSQTALRRAEKLFAPQRPLPEPLLDLVFRRDIERLHAKGPEALFALFQELGREKLIRTDLELRVRRHADYVTRRRAAVPLVLHVVVDLSTDE